MDNTVQIIYISFATNKVWLLQLLQGEGAADGSSGSPPPMTEVDPAAEFLAKEQVHKWLAAISLKMYCRSVLLKP